MTAHPHGAEPNPLRDLETALRIARAATHEHKLERPVAEAFARIVDFGHAVVDAFRAQEREIGQLRKDVAQLQALESKRVIIDP